MRNYQTKRGFSTSYKVLLPDERAIIKKIHPIQPVTIKGKVVNRWNPYIRIWLEDRYKVFQNSVVKKHNMVEYKEAVAQWYKYHNYVDKNGNPSVWAAIRAIEIDHPDIEWKKTPEKPSSKSHHSTFEKSKAGSKRKRELATIYRHSPKGKETIRRYKERLKMMGR